MNEKELRNKNLKLQERVLYLEGERSFILEMNDKQQEKLDKIENILTSGINTYQKMEYINNIIKEEVK